MSQTSVEKIRQMVSFNSEQFLMKTDDANGVAFVLKRITRTLQECLMFSFILLFEKFELSFQLEINNVVIGLKYRDSSNFTYLCTTYV